MLGVREIVGMKVESAGDQSRADQQEANYCGPAPG
jgi:hypothetical protein